LFFSGVYDEVKAGCVEFCVFACFGDWSATCKSFVAWPVKGNNGNGQCKCYGYNYQIPLMADANGVAVVC
jgi:hypothetical protein